MRKIIIINPLENIFENKGIRHLKFAEQLSENKLQKNDIHYITSNFSHTDKKHHSNKLITQGLAACNKYKIHICTVPGYKKNISLHRIITHWVFAVKVAYKLKYIYSKKDLILINSIGPELPLVLKIIGIKGQNIIVDVRDIWPDSLIKGTKILQLGFHCYCSSLYNISLKKVKNFIIVSKSFEGWVKRYSSSFDQVLYIPLGFDSNRWKNIQPINEISDKIKIVYVGNLNYQFPLDEFLQAAKSNIDIEIFIIGKGEKTNYYKKIAPGNVVFTGYLSKEEVTKLISESHIGLLPLDRDSKASTPNKLFDYIAANRPILCYKENDSSKLIDENNIGWTVNQDKDEILKILNSLNKKDIIKKSKNIEKIRDSYSMQNLYPRIIDHIIKLR